MFKQVMIIGLFAISIVVTSGRDATAGCASIGGVWTCATWIKGSMQGLSNSHFGEPIKCNPAAGDCPTVTFEARGTEGVGESEDCQFEGDSGCGIPGVLVCLQKKCTDPNNIQCLNSAKTFGHTEVGALSVSNTTKDCTKKNCNTFKNQATLGLGVDADDCPPGNPVSDFTATLAIFRTSLCRYGYGNDDDPTSPTYGQCCDSPGHTETGRCLGLTSSPVNACFRCSLPTPLPSSGTEYTCEELTPSQDPESTWVGLGCAPYGKNN